MLGNADALSPAGLKLIDAVGSVAKTVVRETAADVDAKSRFPAESINALREIGALGALVPEAYGGLDCTVTDAAVACRVLGAERASTAMVLAMHHIQVASIVRHRGDERFFAELLSKIADDRLLLASATSEVGIGGDIRSSNCAVERNGTGFALRKSCSVISYGASADGILATARSDASSAPSDQVLVYVPVASAQLHQTNDWDALGMRGTGSVGFELYATGSLEQILPETFGEIASRTMLPVSHLLWGSLWIGIAAGAMARARQYVRAAARRNPGIQPLSMPRLVAATARLESLQATLDTCLADYEFVRDDPSQSTSVRWALQLNNLKLLVSTGIFEIVSAAMLVCGIIGFRNDTEYSIGRYLRDATSASLMVHNDRIVDHNAVLLSALKG